MVTIGLDYGLEMCTYHFAWRYGLGDLLRLVYIKWSFHNAIQFLPLEF